MIILLVLISIFLMVEFFLFLYGKKEEDRNCDYMIILGAGLYGDRISNALKRRLDKAFCYVQKVPNIKIIVSGGQGKDELCSEASAMKKYLITLGVDENQIIEEDQSVSTYTNFLYTKKLLGSNQHSLLVVTCDFHMYRSICLGKQMGFECYRYPAKSIGYSSIKYYIREFFCVIKYYLMRT